MLTRALRLCRSHPIAVAALIGALFGAAKVFGIEFGGLTHRDSGGVLSLLWSSSAPHAGQVNAFETALLLLIEVAGNVLVFALLFAVPVAAAVGIRRIFNGRREKMNDRAEISSPEARSNE